MLLNDYEWGRIESDNELEKYCKLEGIDYAYLKTIMRPVPAGKCANASGSGRNIGISVQKLDSIVR